MSDPKVIKRLMGREDVAWADIIEVKRGERVIGKQAYLCQGDKDNATEFFISSFDIRSIIELLERVEKELR